MSTNGSNGGPPEDGQEPDPRIAWMEAAGIDPTTLDPSHARQGLDYWSALNHRDHAGTTIEHTLRQRGYLPEGLSLDDLRAWADQASQPDDPWDGVVPVHQPPPDPQGGYYDDPGGYDQQPPPPPPFDPGALRSAVDRQVQEAERRIVERIQAEQQQRAFESEFRGEMERLRSDGLGETAAMGVMVRAGDLQATMPSSTLRERVDAARKAHDAELDAALAARAERQRKVNEESLSIPPGPPPSGQGLAGSLEALLERETGRA